jgi:hypothetical protein
MEQKVITVDFDLTLASEELTSNGWMYFGSGILHPIPEVIDYVRQMVEDGCEVHIVTYRNDEDIPEVREFVDKWGIPIKEIHNTNKGSKIPVLQRLGSTLHIDDHLSTVIEIEKAGITCLLVDDGSYDNNCTAELFNRIYVNIK